MESKFHHAAEVERRHGLSHSDFVREYVLPGKPVVLTDAVQNWPAIERWTPAYLKEQFGHRQVSFRDKPKELFSLGDYVDMALASTHENPVPYLSGFEMRELLPELLPDIEPPIMYAEPDRCEHPLYLERFKNNRLTEMLIGGVGTKFALHYDVHHTHGFVTQIYGDKEFTIFGPSESKFLYPDPNARNRSLIPDIHEVDLDVFPLFPDSTPIRTVVRAGETIFQPSGWWHTTRVVTPSIAIVRSTVSPDLWINFVHDLCQRASADPSARDRLRNRLKKTYLLAVHPLMSLSERFASDSAA